MSYNVGIESGNANTIAGLSWSRSGTTVTITHSGHAVGTFSGNTIKITASSDTAAIPLGYYTTSSGTTSTIVITGVNTGATTGTVSYQYAAARGITTSITPTPIMSFSIWMNPAQISPNLRLFDQASRRVIYGAAGATLNYQCQFSVVSDFSIDLAAEGITSNNWYHICVTHDATSISNIPTIYVNGVSRSVTTVTAPSGSLANTAALVNIGNNTGRIRSFNGKLAELAVWTNKLLSAEEVLELSIGANPSRKIPDLLFYSPMFANKSDRIISTPFTEDATSGFPLPTFSDDHPKILSS